MTASRETILAAVKEATRIPSALPEPPEELEDDIEKTLQSITPAHGEALRDQFKTELELVAGEYYCARSAEAAVKTIHSKMREQKYATIAATSEPLTETASRALAARGVQVTKALDCEHRERKESLAAIPAALVEAQFALADTGSLVFLYEHSNTTLPHFLSEYVCALVHRDNLLAHQFDLFARLSQEDMKNMVIVTGPSRTADIEKILVLGAHGPRRLLVILCEW